MPGLPVAEIAENQPNVRANVVAGFSNPAVSLFYIIAIVMLSTHLFHGIWSMFQSVGFSHPRYTPLIRKFANIFSWILVAGFIAVPLSVMFGLVR